MSNDLFNNTSNDYVYPSLSPCPNVADDQILEWTKNGLTIIKGSQEIASIDFNDLAIPINAFSKQQKILQEGEVIFIPGLANGLCAKQMGFTLPPLTSDDNDLNLYYMQIDLSISYIRNFSTTYSNIDVSSDYATNLDIANALNINISDKSISVSSSYDPSILTFSGSVEGYDFDITNVVLTLIDSSMDEDSPFQNGQNAATYNLLEDPSARINSSKYPNTAMQGIILKSIYPDENESESDKWVYVNHVSDYVVMYDASLVNDATDVSTSLIVSFGNSFVEPSISFDASTFDASIYGEIISNELGQDCYYEDCSISNSMFYLSKYVNSYVTDSSIANDSIINNGAIVANTLLTNVWTNTLRLLVYQDPCTGSKMYEYSMEDDSLSSLSNVNIEESTIWDSSINKTTITDCSIYNSYIQDSSLIGCTAYNCTFDLSTNSINTKDILVDPSISCNYEINADSSTYYIRRVKKLEVGMNGTSTNELLSVGDYLNWISLHNRWKKFSEMYVWTTSVDTVDCTIKNLIDGFYVFNPHSFMVKLEYLTFI
jgi:hypothetical protein